MPSNYAQYLAFISLLAGAPLGAADATTQPEPADASAEQTYRVKRGDSLWKISRGHWGKGIVYPGLARENQRDAAAVLPVDARLRLTSQEPVLSEAEKTYVALATPVPTIVSSPTPSPESAAPQAMLEQAPKPVVKAAPKPVAVVAAPTPVATEAAAPAPAAIPPQAAAPAAEDQGIHLALGVGYPDLRVRLGFGPALFADARYAADAGVQIYAGRLGWSFLNFQGLKLLASAEASVANFNDVDTVSGSGTSMGLAVGAEYPFARVCRVSLDIGPVWMQGSNSLGSVRAADIVVNTALYFYLF